MLLFVFYRKNIFNPGLNISSFVITVFLLDKLAALFFYRLSIFLIMEQIKSLIARAITRVQWKLLFIKL